jgi:hypothetical protein
MVNNMILNERMKIVHDNSLHKSARWNEHKYTQNSNYMLWHIFIDFQQLNVAKCLPSSQAVAFNRLGWRSVRRSRATLCLTFRHTNMFITLTDESNGGIMNRRDIRSQAGM